VEQSACAIGRRAHKKEIGFAIAVVVEETSAGAWPDFRGIARGGLHDFRDGLRRKADGNRGRRILHGTARQFGEREPALIAVRGPEGRAKMLGSYFLEFGEMLARRGSVAAALVGACEAKFCGRVIRKQSESFLKGGNGLVVTLKLGIKIADEIPGIGLVGELRDVRESVDAFFRVPKILVGKAEVVPRKWILRQFFGGRSESCASWFEFLLRQKRDAEIQTGDFEFGIGGERFFEIFLSIGGSLLIHVGNAEGVEAVGFGSVVLGRGLLCFRWIGLRVRRARMEKRGSGKE